MKRDQFKLLVAQTKAQGPEASAQLLNGPPTHDKCGTPECCGSCSAPASSR